MPDIIFSHIFSLDVCKKSKLIFIYFFAQNCPRCTFHERFRPSGVIGLMPNCVRFFFTIWLSYGGRQSGSFLLRHSVLFYRTRSCSNERGVCPMPHIAVKVNIASRENYNNIYIQEPVYSRVVEFCVVLTSVTKSRDHFGLYSLTGSTSVPMSMFTLTAV